jgi:heme-degrading monooxygenase HmoA
MIFRRLRGDEVEFLVVSLWATLNDLRNFAGQDPEVAVYFPEDEKYLLEIEPNVRHYDVPTFEMDHGATRSDTGGTAAEVDYQMAAPIHFMR